MELTAKEAGYSDMKDAMHGVYWHVCGTIGHKT